MEFIKETSIENFEAWSGAKDTLETVIERGDCEQLEELLMNCFAETPTETQINDFLWFESDFIYEELGYTDLLD